MMGTLPEDRPDDPLERERTDFGMIRLAKELGELAPLSVIGTPAWLELALRRRADSMRKYWRDSTVPREVAAFTEKYPGVET